MDKLIIHGPAKLKGEVLLSASKNASLPIMAGILLCGKTVTLKGLPQLRDVRTMNKLLSNMGVEITEEKNQTHYLAKDITSREATYDLVKTMRASILVLGPLLARFGEAKVSLPGGCAIGTRPIDIHLMGLEKMGAQIQIHSGYVEARAKKLQGANILLPFPSVGATENLMMAAVLAEGTTQIENAAKEPEIEDLANFLIQLGANIQGAGTHQITIVGVKELKSAMYAPIGDRIEGATYLMAGVITNSEITVKNISPMSLGAVLDVLTQMGARFETDVEKSQIKVLPYKVLKGINVDTAPFPGFPTDAQAQLMAVTTVASSASTITEHIFENRFMHVPELARMGAKIVLKGNTAVIEGVPELSGAPVMCTDLRASAALVVAALRARGATEIQRVYHLDRGYEHLDQKLSQLGVKIERINEGD